MQKISVWVLYLDKTAGFVINILVSLTVIHGCIIGFWKHLFYHISGSVVKSALYAAVCIVDADTVAVCVIFVTGAFSVFPFFCIAYRMDFTGDIAVKITIYTMMLF